MPPDLLELFADGTLVRPTDDEPNLVHVIRALAYLSGVSDIPLNAATQTVLGLVGDARHLIFILMDGLGMDVLNRLPADSFLRGSFRRQIHAICPSTTACALTSITTAAYPNQHAVTGWFTYLPELSLTMATLPFIERVSGEPLIRRAIHVDDVLPIPPVAARMTRAVETVCPSYIAHTPYNEYARGGTPGVGYTSIAGAVDHIVARLTHLTEPSYTHLYLPEVDSICHKRGTESPEVVPLVMSIDAELRRLAAELPVDSRIVLTADHGLINVPESQQTLLFDEDPLLETLVVPPTGDARMPVFHVKPDERASFMHQFYERFGQVMTLVSTERAEQLELFGPGVMSPLARERFGDFVAFPFKPATLAYHPPGRPVGHLFLAVHAGLSPQEMRVPLCVA